MLQDFSLTELTVFLTLVFTIIMVVMIALAYFIKRLTDNYKKTPCLIDDRVNFIARISLKAADKCYSLFRSRA